MYQLHYPATTVEPSGIAIFLNTSPSAYCNCFCCTLKYQLHQNLQSLMLKLLLIKKNLLLVQLIVTVSPAIVKVSPLKLVVTPPLPVIFSDSP